MFVDIDPATFNLDPARVAEAVTDRTRAIVAVHLFGQMADMDGLASIATPKGIAIIEDAAQAIGARRRVDGVWKSSGTVGLAGTFSFFPSKNLGGWGDGGMIVTNDAERSDRLRKLRVHGGPGPALYTCGSTGRGRRQPQDGSGRWRYRPYGATPRNQLRRLSHLRRTVLPVGGREGGPYCGL